MSSDNDKDVEPEVVGILSNFEVYKFFNHLKDTGAVKRIPRQQNTSLATAAYETLRFLQSTPSATQTEECVKEFMERLRPYNFTKQELLILLNNRPTQPVHIQAMIEESEERLTEDQVDEVLQIIEETLPPPDPSLVRMRTASMSSDFEGEIESIVAASNVSTTST